jgi:hypothetical protein
MKYIPSLSIVVFALASATCGRGQGVRFEIYTQHMNEVEAIQIEVCGKTLPAQRTSNTFVLSAEVKCEGQARVFVTTSRGSTIECGGVYVTPGMGRVASVSARVMSSEQTCHLEPIRRPG